MLTEQTAIAADIARMAKGIGSAGSAQSQREMTDELSSLARRLDAITPPGRPDATPSQPPKVVCAVS